MDDEYGYIEVHYEVTNDREPSKVTYEWKGSPLAFLSPDAIFRHSDTIKIDVEKGAIQIGQYKARIIETSDIRDFLIMREGNSFSEWLLLRWLLFKRWIKLINSRSKSTAIIWNLMETELGSIPQWNELKILKKFRKSK